MKRQRVRENRIRGKSGQILVVVLLVVVVSLAIGLSVASRNLTNLKGSTQAEQSQRAFTAAEGGVESTLSKLNDVARAIDNPTAGNIVSAGCSSVDTPNKSATCSLGNTPSGVDSNISNSNVLVKANNTYERVVEPGDVAQVNLQGMVVTNTLVVKWAKKTNANEASPYKATLEFTFVCSNDNTAICITTPKGLLLYGQHREAITIDTISSQSGGFLQCGTNSGTFITTVTTDSDFYCAATFTLPASNAQIIRIKPFWNGTTINVSGASLPVQTYDITSTATTDSGLSRKVQVSRDALPQLPAIFDYVLYSGGDIIK